MCLITSVGFQLNSLSQLYANVIEGWFFTSLMRSGALKNLHRLITETKRPDCTVAWKNNRTN